MAGKMARKHSASADDIALPASGGTIDRLRRAYGSDRVGLERAVAERLFTAHKPERGALRPLGFGFLQPADRAPWLERARAVLGEVAA